MIQWQRKYAVNKFISKFLALEELLSNTPKEIVAPVKFTTQHSNPLQQCSFKFKMLLQIEKKKMQRLVSHSPRSLQQNIDLISKWNKSRSRCIQDASPHRWVQSWSCSLTFRLSLYTFHQQYSPCTESSQCLQASRSLRKGTKEQVTTPTTEQSLHQHNSNKKENSLHNGLHDTPKQSSRSMAVSLHNCSTNGSTTK